MGSKKKRKPPSNVANLDSFPLVLTLTQLHNKCWHLTCKSWWRNHVDSVSAVVLGLRITVNAIALQIAKSGLRTLDLWNRTYQCHHGISNRKKHVFFILWGCALDQSELGMHSLPNHIARAEREGVLDAWNPSFRNFLRKKEEVCLVNCFAHESASILYQGYGERPYHGLAYIDVERLQKAIGARELMPFFFMFHSHSCLVARS